MEENKPTEQKTVAAAAPQAAAPVVAAGAPAQQPMQKRSFDPRDRNQRNPRKNTRKGPGRDGRAKPEFDQKMIQIRRVTRVAAGGRRFSFSVALVAGNRKGSVGVGIGKGADTSLAIDKALRNAKKNLVKLELTKNMSISHEVRAKYASSRVMIMPAKGKGIVAGSSVRNVLELAGVTDVTAKLLSRSKNKLNNARVAMEALKMLTVIKKPNPEVKEMEAVKA